MWEYVVFPLWDVGSEDDEINDISGAVVLLNARGAEGWELVSVVRQLDLSARGGFSHVAYMKRRREA